jgi:transposase
MLLTRPNTLSDKQCRELEEVKRTAQDVRVYRRAKVILYRNAGYTPDEILEHTDYSEREQRDMIRRYREDGIAGLLDRPRSGRPRLEKPENVEQQTIEEAGGVIPAHEPSREPNGEPKKPENVEQQTVEETGSVISAHEPSSEPEKTKTEANLDELAQETLECMQKYHPKRYLRERAQMLLWRNDGYSAREIADMLGVSMTTVRQVFTTYDREKLAGLYRKPGSGRLSKLRAEQWEQFAKWVREGPKALGYRFVKWTTRSLRKYIFKRFNITCNREWIRRKLHEFTDYSWTRGKKVYAYPENKKRNTERKIFAENMLSYLKQAREGKCLLLFEDESIFTLFGEVG